MRIKKLEILVSKSRWYLLEVISLGLEGIKLVLKNFLIKA